MSRRRCGAFRGTRLTIYGDSLGTCLFGSERCTSSRPGEATKEGTVCCRLQSSFSFFKRVCNSARMTSSLRRTNSLIKRPVIYGAAIGSRQSHWKRLSSRGACETSTRLGIADRQDRSHSRGSSALNRWGHDDRELVMRPASLTAWEDTRTRSILTANFNEMT